MLNFEDLESERFLGGKELAIVGCERPNGTGIPFKIQIQIKLTL